MRFITYLALSLVVVCLAAYTAVAAEYGWEAENFAARDGDGPGVFSVPLNATDGTGVNFTIDEAYSNKFAGSEDGSGLTGVVTYGIRLPASGSWHFWGRAIGPPTGDNSFFWSIDGPAAVGGAGMEIWDFNEAAGSSNNFPLGDPPPKGALQKWMWFRISSREGPYKGVGNDAVGIKLSRGGHVFNMAIREDGAYMDALFGTTDASFDANVTAPTAVEPQGKLATTWANMKGRI
jgi:hypothetical protein